MKLSFYAVKSDYCDFLRLSDPNVPYTMNKKARRPFIGIVFSVGDHNYYVPLTSPKPKHLKMKNNLDFQKINGGRWGALNFNNMIPVIEECISKVDIKINENDDANTVNYKNLLANQLSWCTANQNAIVSKAKKLYALITSGNADEKIKARGCDFLKDEEQSLLYRK